jgi:hypothetical protein
MISDRRPPCPLGGNHLISVCGAECTDVLFLTTNDCYNLSVRYLMMREEQLD